MTTTSKTFPRCGSTLVVEIANQRQCNSCSLDFDLVRSPVARTERVPLPGSRFTITVDEPSRASRLVGPEFLRGDFGKFLSGSSDFRVDL